MDQMSSRVSTADDVDRLRAGGYDLLAHLLARPPTAETLRIVAAIRGDDSPFGQALNRLADAASDRTVQQAEREYHHLFIGLTRGELLPFASYYLTGFLNEKPLARLRADMQALGIERAPDVSEPEDHIAALCEMMAGLILGRFGEPADPAAQQRFFDRHLASWAGRFFADLERAEHALLYRPVGTVGRLFLGIEAEAFALAG
jgi:TorA maturation chaperone TorD